MTSTLNDYLSQPKHLQTLTNAEIAHQYGVSTRTVRRRRAALRQAPATPTPIPDGAVPLKGKISEFTPGEGWRSTEFSFTPDQSADRILTLEQVTEPLTAHPGPNYYRYSTTTVTTTTTTTTKTFVISLSDLQTGGVDEGGGTEELSRRIASVFTQIEEYLVNHNTFDEIILADTGDILEGFSNTVAQQQTNDLSLTDQIRYAQRVVVEAIRRFAPFTPKFTYIAVPSNHCAVRTSVGNKNRSNAPNDDWGILIQENIEEALSFSSEYDHVRFVRPSKWEEAVTHRTVDGTTLAVVHGHQFRPGKAGEYLAGMVLGRRSGFHEADVLLFGHHHNFSIGLAGAGQHIIGAPTLDNGSSWFSNTTGVSSPSSLLVFQLSNKTSSNWRVLLPRP